MLHVFLVRVSSNPVALFQCYTKTNKYTIKFTSKPLSIILGIILEVKYELKNFSHTFI